MNDQMPIKRTTRQHRSGNSFSVRLPGETAYPDPHQELEVEVVGNTRVLRPKVPERISVSEMFRRLEALGPSTLGPEALIRGYGRPLPGLLDDTLSD